MFATMILLGLLAATMRSQRERSGAADVISVDAAGAEAVCASSARRSATRRRYALMRSAAARFCSCMVWAR